MSLESDAYYIIAAQLDASGLRQTDATCRLFKRMNASLWEALGTNAFRGLELPDDGLFEDAARNGLCEKEQQCRKRLRVDWRGRFHRFGALVREFRGPFQGPRILEVPNADEVAYGKCFLRSDVLKQDLECGAYFEVEVAKNADNISLSVVDFEDGGKSSVTFGPMTGAVLRETKVLEQPGVVQGAYIQPLSKQGDKFKGHMGLYIKGGEIAFFRKVDDQPWETTGFVSDLSWAEGCRLTPCLAFRDAGAYHVSVTQVGSEPPVMPHRVAGAFKKENWRAFMI